VDKHLEQSAESRHYDATVVSDFSARSAAIESRKLDPAAVQWVVRVDRRRCSVGRTKPWSPWLVKWRRPRYVFVMLDGTVLCTCPLATYCHFAGCRHVIRVLGVRNINLSFVGLVYLAAFHTQTLKQLQGEGGMLAAQGGFRCADDFPVGRVSDEVRDSLMASGVWDTKCPCNACTSAPRSDELPSDHPEEEDRDGTWCEWDEDTSGSPDNGTDSRDGTYGARRREAEELHLAQKALYDEVNDLAGSNEHHGGALQDGLRQAHLQWMATLAELKKTVKVDLAQQQGSNQAPPVMGGSVVPDVGGRVGFLAPGGARTGVVRPHTLADGNSRSKGAYG
jgi:hypothetical protein